MKSKSLIPNFFKYSQTVVDSTRSGFQFKMPLKGSCMIGRLIPAGAPIPIIPGDTANLYFKGLFRSGTLIAPILDDMFIDVMSCWVPWRIIWNNYNQWLGENETTAWTQTLERDLPNIDIFVSQLFLDNGVSENFNFSGGIISFYEGLTAKCDLGSVMGNLFLHEHFGYMAGALSALLNSGESSLEKLQFTVLEDRAYYSVWNNIWRDANWMRPVLFSKGDTGSEGEFGYWLGNSQFLCQPGQTDSYLFESGDSCAQNQIFGPLWALLMPTCKFHDSATSVLPEPQAGDAVSISLAGDAPVIGASVLHDVGEYGLKMSFTGQTQSIPYGLVSMNNGSSILTGLQQVESSEYDINAVNNTNMVANLSDVSVISINDFRKLYLMQEYKELLARGGQHAEDIINTFFGVSDSTVLCTKPEILSHRRFAVGIQQVVATADSKIGESTSHLGDTGAYSLTGISTHLGRKTFTEHGFVVNVFTIRPLTTYSQQIPEQFRRIGKFDNFWRVFDHIGEQGFDYLFINGGTSFPGQFIGYQEAWYSYRTQRASVSGALSPVYAGSLNYWTLAEVFDPAMEIGPDFFCTNEKVLDRALVADHENYPQFIYDIVIEGSIYRGMSAHSFPLMLNK